MKVDIEDVLFWMDAIRNSDDRYRTLESFWKGQVRSKIWLIENLGKFAEDKPNRIVIHGGWNGVLASLLFNSNILIENIISVDIDPTCKKIADTINKRYDMEGRFTSVTEDMANFTYDIVPDIVINTSTEHVTDDLLTLWKSRIPKKSLIVLQSNDYFDLDEHINCVSSINKLDKKIGLNTFYKGTFPTEKYNRFMVIGKKI